MPSPRRPAGWKVTAWSTRAVRHLARIAAALAEALELPGADSTWRTPLPPLPPPSPLAVVWRETVWTVRHLLPWMLVRTLAPALRTGPPAGAAPDLHPITLR